MFGNRGRGSAILDVLRRLREEEEARNRQQQALCPRGQQEVTEEGLSGSSSLDSINVSTSNMTLNNSTVNLRRCSTEASNSEPSSPALKSEDPMTFTGGSPKSSMSNSVDDNSEERVEEIDVATKASWQGTSGEKIDLQSNYIKLRVNNERRQDGFFCHHVHFEPELDSKSLRRKLLNSRKDVLGPAIIFDGFLLYLPYRYNKGDLYSKNQKYRMTVSFFRNQAYKDKESIPIYNILFKQVCGALNMIQIKKNSFLPSKAVHIDQHGLEIWPGYVTAINDYGPSGLLLLCDMKSKVIRTQTVRDVIKDIIINLGNNLNDVRSKIKKALIGEVVLTKYNNKTYRVDDVDFDSSPVSTFEMNGREETFKNYYSQQYQIDVKDLKQPLLINYPKIPRIVNGESKNNYGPISLIPELCYMTGLNDRMRNNFILMKDLSTLTKMSVPLRKVTIEKLLQEIQEKEEARQILSRWGLALAEEPLSLEGRVLEPSFIRFGNGHRIYSNVDFSKDVLNNSVVGPVDITNWILVFDQRNQEFSKYFVSTLKSGGIARNLGIRIDSPKMIGLQGSRTEEFAKRIRHCLNGDTSIQLVVTVVDSPKSDLYSAVKKICCVEYSVASQFILKKNLAPHRKSQAIISKIALQIVCKLGGELWAGHSPYKNAMIVGIDVYHDPDRQHRSCLGFVASLNSTYTQWSSWTNRNADHQEISHALGNCLKRAIQEYIEHNGEAPSRIVVYRDGVGDSRLNMVEDYEAPQMLNVCESFNGRDDPPIKLTVIVVSKKVNTRVIGINGNFVSNPPVGTVVDHSITENRTYPNFYLVSQKVGEGTVTPTHYIMAYDNSNMPAEHAQRLSYRLTFMYFNWPGSIRVPVPCQYAHKLASLVGEYIGTQTNPALSNKLFYL